MFSGKINILVGFLALLFFMLYGFLLIYLRDFAPGKEQWIAEYGVGTHFEARLAHVHGNLFALINIVVGLFLVRLPATRMRAWTSGLTLAGMLMPLGIVFEIVLGLSPVFVIGGGISMVVAMGLLVVASWRMETAH